MGKNRLSRDEIESLLQAVDPAAPSNVRADSPLVGSASAGPDPCVDALGDAAARDTTSPAPARFPGPQGSRSRGVERLRGRSPSPGDRAAVEALAAHLGKLLSEQLRASVQVGVVGVTVTSEREFLQGGRQSAFLAISETSRDKATIWLDIHPGILCVAVNRMLGGSLQDEPLAFRTLTPVERGVARRFADRVVSGLLDFSGESRRDNWLTRLKPDPAETRREKAVDEPLTGLDLTLQVGPIQQRLRIAVPDPIYERILDRNARGLHASDGSVEIAVVAARTRVPLEQLADLQVGDVLTSPDTLDEPLQVLVNHRVRFRGTLGTLDGQRAIRIERLEDTISADRVSRPVQKSSE